MEEPTVVFENVYKSYILYYNLIGIKNFIFHFPQIWRTTRQNKFEALHDISFQIYRGETVGFIGCNGAGKSTILGLIARVIFANRGKVTVRGRVSPLLQLGAGFHPDLTGRENVFLNAIILGMNYRDTAAKFDSILEFSELGEFINQPIRTYSTGMVARLAFSVAIHIEPEILLIDEILSGGDAAFQNKCFNKILEFKKRGVTIILVSHAMDTINNICNRVIWMEKGKILEMGSNIAEIISRYTGNVPIASPRAMPDC